MLVQSFGTAQVAPGGYANFVMWVWAEQALSTGTDVAVKLSVLNAPTFGSPAFIVCPPDSSTGNTCTLGLLSTGQADELEAVVEVPTSATAGQQWQMSATVSATPAANGSQFISQATDVVAATTPSPTPTPTITPITSATTPAASGTVAPIAGTSVAPTNPSGLFPTVGTSSGTGSGNLPSPNAHSALRGNTTAADVPLDARLLGGQIAGLAVLAGAIAIAITRLSLRRQKLNANDPNAPSQPQQ